MRTPLLSRLVRWAALMFVLVALTPTHAHAQGWQLVWSDEFHGTISPDWRFETGNGSGGWGNNELEYYRRENATVENDALVITAKREDYAGYRYTSARMTTQGTRSFRYGRMEARMKLPAKQGLWPAFWMLGTDIDTVGWPACGEIDVMEQINTDPTVYGTVHWQADDGSHASYGNHMTTTVTDWHVYAVEWSPTTIKWFVDGTQYHVIDITNGIGGTDEFQRDFFLLLNLAVGGNWPGNNIDDGALPQKMYVDYVRVYAAGPPSGLTSWTSQNVAGSVIRQKNSRGRIDPAATVTPVDDANWNMVPGLAGGGVSFQSKAYPTKYLRHRNGEAWLDKNDGSDLFKQDATFNERPGLSNAASVSFESWNQPGLYLRHRHALLYVEAATTARAKADATFIAGPPLQGASIQIEAENYAAMSGMQAEPCAEGGQDMGWIDANDWIVWNVNVPVSGTYTVQYRVASLAGGGTLQLEQAGGAVVYGQLPVPSTGGWQAWTTISHQVTLTAGTQQIAVKALAGGWNLNWLKLVR